VPYLKRKIAVTTVVTHTIEHEGNVLKLEVGLSVYGYACVCVIFFDE